MVHSGRNWDDGEEPRHGGVGPHRGSLWPWLQGRRGQSGVSKNTYLNSQDAAVEGWGLWGNLWEKVEQRGLETLWNKECLAWAGDRGE